MTELLNNQTIQLIIAAVSAFGGTIAALAIFLSKLISAVKSVKQNSEEFKAAKGELTTSKAESEALRADIVQMKSELLTIRQRQEIAYCNTKELVVCGAAKTIMSTGEEVKERERGSESESKNGV